MSKQNKFSISMSKFFNDLDLTKVSVIILLFIIIISLLMNIHTEGKLIDMKELEKPISLAEKFIETFK